MKIEILPEAQADLDDAYWFYERLAPGLASISSDIRSLQLFGGIHALHQNKHRMLASRFPYSVFYRVEDSEIRVYAVLDTRRDPDWISERLN